MRAPHILHGRSMWRFIEIETPGSSAAARVRQTCSLVVSSHQILFRCGMNLTTHKAMIITLSVARQFNRANNLDVVVSPCMAVTLATNCRYVCKCVCVRLRPFDVPEIYDIFRLWQPNGAPFFECECIPKPCDRLQSPAGRASRQWRRHQGCGQRFFSNHQQRNGVPFIGR